MDWMKLSGRVEVLGIQEIPQQNAAIVDIQFDDFQHNADYFGTPISKDKKSPPEPKVGSPTFYDDLQKAATEQVNVKSYSGKGVGTLKHYTDGRWVLTDIDFNFLRLNANLEIQ